MPSIRSLFARVRPDVRLSEPLADAAPEPAPNGHVGAPVRPVAADEGVRIIRLNPPPPATPPRLAPDPTAVPLAARLQPPSSRPRVSKLEALTAALGRRRAGQALWAPERLNKADRATAARILKELDQ